MASPNPDTADEPIPAASEASAEREPTEQANATAFMNAMMRGQIGQLSDASNPDADADGPAPPDGASAQDTGVKPSGGSRQTASRRGAAAELERLRAENARLEAEAQARDRGPDPSAEVRARAQQTEARYRKLLGKPESDPDWTHDDIQFLEGQKQRRALVPELTQHYETVVAQDLEAHRAAYAGWVEQFRQAVAADLATAEQLPGVDFEAIKAAPTFADRDRLVFAAGRGQADAEIRALREENASLKRDLFGATRAPLNGGRSSPGRSLSTNDYMNELMRRGTG